MTKRTNAKPDLCTDCDHLVNPGEGNLWWQPGPDDGGDIVGGTPAGWRVTHLDRSVCVENKRLAREQASQERAQRRKEAEEREAAEDREREEQRAKIELLLSEIPDCVCSGYDWDSSVVGKGERVSPGWARHTAYDGSTAYCHAFGNACVLHASRHVVERAWAQFPNPSAYSHPDEIAKLYTPEASAAWLAEYGPESPRVREAREKKARGEWVSICTDRPCAGWECHAYRVGRIDLLKSEGVL